MRSKSDPISLLKERMLSSNMASVEELKVSGRNTLILTQTHNTRLMLLMENMSRVLGGWGVIQP